MPKKAKQRIHQCTCNSCQLHPHGKIAKQHAVDRLVLLELNERNRRRFVGVLANERGRGGTSHLAEVTGLSRTTIARGRHEIERASQKQSGKVRQAGAGRPRVEKNNPGS